MMTYQWALPPYRIDWTTMNGFETVVYAPAGCVPLVGWVVQVIDEDQNIFDAEVREVLPNYRFCLRIDSKTKRDNPYISKVNETTIVSAVTSKATVIELEATNEIN